MPFNEQLAKFDTPKIDFYLLHGLNADRWNTVRRLRGLEALERARADGPEALGGQPGIDNP